MSEHRIGITFDTGGTEGDLSDIGKVLEDVAKGGKKAQDELKRTSQALREQGGSVNQVAAAFTAATAKVAQFKNSASAGLRSAARDGEQAAAAIADLEQRINEVRATGGPVPKNWTAAVESLTAAVDESTRAAARSRAAMESQRRELEDSTRAAGGFRNGFGSMSDILGEIHPKLETTALKAGLFWGAMQVIEGGANQVAESIGVIGKAFGSNADVVDKAVAQMRSRLAGLFSMGPQMLVFAELMKLRGADFSGVTGGSSSNQFGNVRGGESASNKAHQDQLRRLEELKAAARAYQEEQIRMEDRSDSLVAAIERQIDNEERLTKAYLKGPKAVKALREELELEESVRKALAGTSISDSGIVRFLVAVEQQARHAREGLQAALDTMNKLSAAKGLTTGQLDPINSAPSLAAAKRSSFFDAIGISEADFRKAHETAQQWRDREIAAVRAAAGDNLDLVQEREQAILDIQRAYAEEMVNAAQTILSNVRGMLSSLQALGINIKGAQKPLGQAQAGMDLYQQGAGAYKAYQSSSLAGSGVGTVAIMAAAVLIISNWYKQRGSAKATATIGSGEDGKLVWDYRNNPMGRDTIDGVRKAVQEAIRFATDFIKGLGGDFKAGAGNYNGVTIGSDGRGKGQTWFVQLANGQIVQFEKDMAAALQFAAIQAVKFAPVGGLDPIVAAAIQKSMAMTVDKFQADVMAAMAVSQLPLSSEGVGFTQSLQGLHSLQEQMTSLLGPTFELADAIRNITSAMEDTIEAERKRLLGIKAIEDFTKRLTDAQSFNTKIEQERARILAEIAKQEAAMAQAYAQANQIQRPGVDGGVPGSQMGPGIPGRDPILPSSVNEAQYAIQALMDQLAGLGDILNLDDVKKGIKDDILGNLYQFLEGNKKYAAEILAWKRKELEMTFEQYKMQLILLGMWDEATQGIWQAALAAGIKGLTKPGNSGGSNRATGIQGAKDAVNDYNLSKLGPVQQALADVNKKWDEHAKAAKGNADLLKKIADARKDEIEQILKQAAMSYRRDKQAFLGKDGGALGQGLQGINDQANELVARARDLYKAGKLTKEEFQKARDAIRDAAAEQRQDMVNSTANGLFMELYGLLGMDKEAAQLKYDLTMAELNIKYQELAIAVEKYKLEGKFLPELQALIDKVKLAGPGIFGPPANDPGGYGGGGGLQDMSDEIERVVKALKEFRDSLLLDDQLSPLTPQQRLDEARRQYEETLRLAQGGNLEAASGLPDIARTFLEIFQEYTGGGGAYAALAQQILAQVRALEERLGGVPHYAQGGIVSHPHLAMVGDGGPEAIIPLKNGFIPSQPQGGDNARLIIGFFGKVPRTLESIDSHLANIDDRLSSPFDRVAAIESRKVRQAGRG